MTIHFPGAHAIPPNKWNQASGRSCNLTAGRPHPTTPCRDFDSDQRSSPVIQMRLWRLRRLVSPETIRPAASSGGPRLRQGNLRSRVIRSARPSRLSNNLPVQTVTDHNVREEPERWRRAAPCLPFSPDLPSSPGAAVRRRPGFAVPPAPMTSFFPKRPAGLFMRVLVDS